MYLSPEKYKEVFSLTPRLCVDIAVKMDGGFLLGRRDHEPFKDQYGLPGGRVKKGESITDALNRIGLGEINTEIDSFKLINYCEFLNEESEYGNLHSVSLVFLCILKNVPQIGFGFSELTNSNLVPYEKIMKPHRILFLDIL